MRRISRSDLAPGAAILVHGAFPPFQLREGVLLEAVQLPRGDISYRVRCADDRVIRVDASRVHPADSGERADCPKCRANSGTDPTAPFP